MSNEPSDARKVIDGSAYVSGNGRLVVDQHPTDQQHLTATQTRESQPLHDCRYYVDDIVPREWLGRPGKLTIERIVGDRGEVIAVWMSFHPSNNPTR